MRLYIKIINKDQSQHIINVTQGEHKVADFCIEDLQNLKCEKGMEAVQALILKIIVNNMVTYAEDFTDCLRDIEFVVESCDCEKN